ncbi:MAG: hypothetical protein KGJ60_09690 [Verrucomicrobiota bacterium]|nr:hypothetical protein [Verrucomicrobiota bacterium]
MEKLKAQLDKLISLLKNQAEVKSRLETLVSVYPFNEFEYIISTLLGAGVLSLDDYYKLREEYIARNLYLYIFEISAPRGFGETWAQGHLKEVLPDLVKPTKKFDRNYSGQYDFLVDKVRVEVKASRAVDFESDEPLYVKALSVASKRPFDMNFQQVKPACCDVFVWVGVWRDAIRYWVLSSKEVESNKYYSTGQHRGNVGEGQLHLKHDNINEFSKCEARSNELADQIRNAFKRQTAK